MTKFKQRVSRHPIAIVTVCLVAVWTVVLVLLSMQGWAGMLSEQKPGLWGMPGWYLWLAFCWGTLLIAVLLNIGWASWQQPDALYHRSAGLIVALTLVQGLWFSAVTPPWQAPDEHAHYEYAALMAVLNRVPTLDDLRQDIQAEVTASMFAYDHWRLIQRQPVMEPPIGFYRAGSLTEFPTTHVIDNQYIYYPQVGDEPPLYYIFSALLYQLTVQSEATLRLYVMRLASVCIWVMLSAALGWAGYTLFPNKPTLGMAAWLVVVFNPMLNHIGSVLSNDVLAALWCTLFLIGLARVFRKGCNWRNVGVLTGCVVLALLTKKSTLWLLPMSGLALFWMPNLSHRWRRFFVRGMAVLALGCLLLWGLPSTTARYWEGVSRIKEPRTHNYVLQITEGSTATQSIGLRRTVPLRGQTVVAEIVSRSPEVAQMEFCLAVYGGTWMCQPLEIDAVWRRAQVVFDVPEDTERLALNLTVLDGTVWVDEVMFVEQPSVIRNHDMEERVSWLEKGLVIAGRPLSIDGLVAGLFANFNQRMSLLGSVFPQAWRLFFDSFWGNFGAALVIPLENPWPLLIRIAVLSAILGWAFQVLRQDMAHFLEASRLLGSAFILALLQTFIPLLSYQGGWLPQGRFIFPAIWPIGMLLTLGWYGWRIQVTERWFALFVAIGSLALNLAGLWRMMSYFYG